MKKIYLILASFFLLSTPTRAVEGIASGIKSLLGAERAKVWLERISFIADENMNNSSPVTVHVVIIYKQELLDEIVKMEAADYFKKADQLKIDNAGQMDVFSFDLIRGQRLNNQEINPSKTSGVGAIIFARYAGPGPHKAVLNEESGVLVKLNKDDLAIEPLKD